MQPCGDPVTGISHEADINHQESDCKAGADEKPFGMGPGNKHHNNRHHTHEHNGGQVFFQRQRHQYTQKCCAEAQHTIAEFSRGRAKFPDQPAQSQDHGKFRNFRRLELQASDTDPPPGTVHRLSEQQNHQKQSDADTI